MLSPKLQDDRNHSGAQTILLAHYGSNWIRGSEQCLLDLVKYIDRRRFNPVVVCNWPVVAEAAMALGATAIVHDAVKPSAMRADSAQVNALREIAAEHNVRLVHANASLLVPALLPVARRLRVPLLAHLHIVPTRLERRHELLHQLSMVVGVSQTSIEGFLDEGMPAEKIRVIYNGVDGNRISQGDATTLRQELGIPGNAVVLGAVGSLIHRKGVDVLIDGVLLLKQRGVNVHLLVVGDGDQRPQLTEQSTLNGTSDIIHFVGERRDAGAVLRDAVDVAVSAARAEAFPLSVLEAAYFERPIVVSDIPPHHEGVVHGKTGLIVAENSAAGFADSITTLAENQELRCAMGQAARERVQRDFSLQRNIQQFEQTYEELIRKPARNYGWLAASSWPRVYNQWITEAVGKRLHLR